MFFVAHIPHSRYALLLCFDAIAMALFAVTGAERVLLTRGEIADMYRLGI